jgi:hypothetical protein
MEGFLFFKTTFISSQAENTQKAVRSNHHGDRAADFSRKTSLDFVRHPTVSRETPVFEWLNFSHHGCTAK